MAARDIDLLFVSSPPNLTWLTGYDSIWYRRTTPTGLAICLSADTTVFFDSGSHVELVHSGTGLFDEAIFFDRRKPGPAVDTIVEALLGAYEKVGFTVPLVVRLEGTNVEIARKLLAESGRDIVSATDLTDAAQKVVATLS